MERSQQYRISYEFVGFLQYVQGFEVYDNNLVIHSGAIIGGIVRVSGYQTRVLQFRRPHRVLKYWILLYCHGLRRLRNNIVF